MESLSGASVPARPPQPGGTGGTRWRHLPNLISALRVVLVAPLLVVIGLGYDGWALATALVAGISDAADGYLARRFHWQSRLGSILDPIADKLMLVGCMLTLGWIEAVPRWLVTLVIARDVVIALGVLAWQSVLRNFRAHPSWISKTTTVAQIGFVLWVLADRAFAWRVPMGIPVWIVAVLTTASGVDYVMRWGWLAGRALKRGGSRT